ncbi:MAG: VOC family protein [Gelidibacter sp.]
MTTIKSQNLQKIGSCLWFDSQAEAAAKFYVSVFKNSGITRTTYYPDSGQDVHGKPAGSVLTVEFQLEGQEFMGLNGGNAFKFNEAISFVVHCDTQDEIDYYWNHLKEGGPVDAQQCGWLKDQFGVSWQIVPNCMLDYMTDKNPQKVKAVFTAMMQMKKMDIAALDAAYANAS